jgi:glycosyltransferase involved in cell wall biosynthesis
MKFALVIPTYKRHKAIERLLNSICIQSLLPNQIIVVDSSIDSLTKETIGNFTITLSQLNYYKVGADGRGAGKQRNYAIERVNRDIDIICFLDDDLVLESNYFEEIINCYTLKKDAIGVGGIDLKDNSFRKVDDVKVYNNFDYYVIDGWYTRESLRAKVRKLFGLLPNNLPGFIPDFSHGRDQLPPNGKIYEVEHFVGMSMSFRKSFLDMNKFDAYFTVIVFMRFLICL